MKARNESFLITGRMVRFFRELRPGDGPNKEMTQQQLSVLVGCSRSKIGLIEQGRRGLKNDDVPRFAKALHVNELLLKTNKSYTNEQLLFLEKVYRLVDADKANKHSLLAIEAIMDSELKSHQS